jgi:CheY-like chemotaxis protein
MDIQMPIMDGHEATRSIRQWEREHDSPRTNIVALTASAFDEQEAKTRESGCDGHVAKPVKKATLFGTISRYVAQPLHGSADDAPAAMMSDEESRRSA